MRKTTALLTVLGLSLVSLLVATSMAPAQGNGVEMALTATATGIEFKLASGGVEVKLKK